MIISKYLERLIKLPLRQRLIPYFILVFFFIVFLLAIPYLFIIFDYNRYFDIYLLSLPLIFFGMIFAEIYFGGYRYYLLSYALRNIKHPSINMIKIDKITNRENCIEFNDEIELREFVLNLVDTGETKKTFIFRIVNFDVTNLRGMPKINLTLEDKRGILVLWKDLDITLDPFDVKNIRTALDYGKQRRSRKKYLTRGSLDS